MSLLKAIQSGKEWRRPYRGSKRFDPSCRNKGRCPWCVGNRTHSTIRRVPADLRDQLRGDA